MTFLYVSLVEYENHQAPNAAQPIEETMPLIISARRDYAPPKQKARFPEVEAKILETLQHVGPAMTAGELADATGFARSTVDKACHALRTIEGTIKRHGAAVRGRPYKYTATS